LIIVRIIVSSINSPFYALSCFLYNIVNSATSETPTTVKNSFQLVSKVNDTRVDPDYRLASLDVISFFY